MSLSLPLRRTQLTRFAFSPRPLGPYRRHILPALPAAARWHGDYLQADKAETALEIPPTVKSAPKLSPSPFYCTTPIFYVNASPHIGHLHSDVLADVLARWNLLRHGGWSPSGALQKKTKTQPILSTGTDEHGLKIQKVAQEAGVDPKALCDEVSQRFKALADAAGIGYTTFIRTTEDRHRVAVHEIWRRLVDAGHIYKGAHEGWYAVSDEAFYPPSQVRSVVDKQSGESFHEAIETGQRVEWTAEVNYKFRLSAFKDRLVEWLESNPEAISPPSRHAEVLQEIKNGLEDLSVSRPSSRLTWSLAVPNDDSQRIYVWIDALINYLTVTNFPWAPPSSEESNGGPEWQGSAWPADVHVVGKDIVRFHAIYWPAMLMAAGLPLPHKIIAHSHWTMGKSKMKMSKSKGNVIDPFVEMEKYGVDTVRYFLCRVGGTLATDSNYDAGTLEEFYRKYLAGQLGNLLSRIASPPLQCLVEQMIRKKRKLKGTSGIPPDVKQRLKTLNIVRHCPGGSRLLKISRPPKGKRELDLESALYGLGNNVDSFMQKGEVSKALEAIFDVLAKANAYMQNAEPWAETEKAEETRLSVIFYIRETLRLTGTLLRPFMPVKMEQLLRDGLNVDLEKQDARPWELVCTMKGNVQFMEVLEKITPLFPRLPVVEES